MDQETIRQIPSPAAQTVHERLKRRIEATKAIRFRSHIRLMRRHKLSSNVVAMLSIYVIAISLIPNFVDLHARQSQVLLACTVVFSVFIIVLAISEGYESYYHQAQVLHGSARALQTLAVKLSLIDRKAADIRSVLTKIGNEYDKILSECEFNHAQCDYHWVSVETESYLGNILRWHPPRFWAKLASEY